MLQQTKALLERADSYQHAGQWQTAIEVCEAIFEHSRRAMDIEDLLESLLRLGLIHGTYGDRDVACEYYELSLTIALKIDDKQRVARSLNGLGILSQRSGDLNLAEQHYSAAKKFAFEIDDTQISGDIELNMGIISNIRGDLQDALEYYRNAIEIYESIDHQPRIARALNNLGMLHIDMHDYHNASLTLKRAHRITKVIQDHQLEGIVLTNIAELLLSVNNLDGARVACDEAFEIASRLGNDPLRADILKSYGVIYRETYKPHLAELHLRQSISLASSLGHPLAQADAYRELALVLRREDRNREALDALNTAHSLFTSLQAKQDQADIDKRFAQLESDFLFLVAKWGESIEAKDRYTSGHCQRVANYACKIAAAANVSERDLTWFRMGAFLHDIGKTEIPESILNKPGKLTAKERKIIEQHTIIGDEILSSTEFPWNIRPMVRSHHERWDGSGYPDGLKGNEIPLAARILHIADVYDALTSVRSYRAPLDPYDAIHLMEEDRGSCDPDLLELFRTILPELSNDIDAVVE